MLGLQFSSSRRCEPWARGAGTKAKQSLRLSHSLPVSLSALARPCPVSPFVLVVFRSISLSLSLSLSLSPLLSLLISLCPALSRSVPVCPKAPRPLLEGNPAFGRSGREGSASPELKTTL